MAEIDVCGLSCPEPVLIVMDILDENKGETIKVISDAAYTRDNIVKLAKEYKYDTNVVESNRKYEITLEMKS